MEEEKEARLFLSSEPGTPEGAGGSGPPGSRGREMLTGGAQRESSAHGCGRGRGRHAEPERPGRDGHRKLSSR